MKCRNGRVLIVCTAAAIFAMTVMSMAADDWPGTMSPKTIADHKLLHHGYVLRVLRSQKVSQSARLADSRSTVDYLAGYSVKQRKWLRLRPGTIQPRYAWIGVRATLRAVQSGGENWGLTLSSPDGKRKFLAPVAYQKVGGRGDKQDCFAEYINQDQFCGATAVQVIWFVESKCLLPGQWKFDLKDSTSPGQPIAGINFTVPGETDPTTVDPCAVKSTPATAHDSDPVERAFQIHAQRELVYGRPMPRRTATGVGTITAAPDVAPEDDATLTLQLVSDGDLLLTDPKGRKTGIDAAEIIEGIPNSSFRQMQPPPSLANDADSKPLKFISVFRPQGGDYVISVINTHGGHFLLTVSGFQNGKSMTLLQSDVHVATPIQYRVRIDSKDLQKLRVFGAFDGDGRGTRGPLLTFATPTQSQSKLPAGNQETELLLFYGSGINPESMSAKLNGSDVTREFHPFENWREVVRLPLQPGENVLELAIAGTVSGKPVADDKRLVFVVPQ